MEKILVLRFLAEGGSAEIYAKKIKGSWLYWQEGSFMDIGEDDGSVWKHQKHYQLVDAFPEYWYMLYPEDINLDFVETIKTACEKWFEFTKQKYERILDAEISWNRKVERNINNSLLP